MQQILYLRYSPYYFLFWPTSLFYLNLGNSCSDTFDKDSHIFCCPRPLWQSATWPFFDYSLSTISSLCVYYLHCGQDNKAHLFVSCSYLLTYIILYQYGQPLPRTQQPSLSSPETDGTQDRQDLSPYFVRLVTEGFEPSASGMKALDGDH